MSSKTGCVSTCIACLGLNDVMALQEHGQRQGAAAAIWRRVVADGEDAGAADTAGARPGGARLHAWPAQGDVDPTQATGLHAGGELHLRLELTQLVVSPPAAALLNVITICIGGLYDVAGLDEP